MCHQQVYYQEALTYHLSLCCKPLPSAYYCHHLPLVTALQMQGPGYR
eukprot:UN15458